MSDIGLFRQDPYGRPDNREAGYGPYATDPRTRADGPRPSRSGGRSGAGSRPPRPPRRRRRRRRGRVLVPLLAIAVLIGAIGGGGYYAYRYVENRLSVPDYPGPGTGEVLFEVEPGDTATDMAGRLTKLGVVRSEKAFVQAAQESGRATEIQPGHYRLRKQMAAKDAVAILLDPKAKVQAVVTVPEGLRTADALTLIAKETGISRKEFARAAGKPGSLGLPSYAKGRLEGYLFPATYEIPPKASARDVLRMMVERYRQAAQGMDLEQVAREKGLKPAEVVVVASMVQAEGGRLSDFPKISRVVYNRLNDGMKLQFDSTVMYAVGRKGIVASNAEIEVDSPYNTYLHAGLPPGPIANPGEAALKAALRPAKGDWFYFVTTDPKRRITEFTSDEDEFWRLRDKLNDYLREHPQG